MISITPKNVPEMILKLLRERREEREPSRLRKKENWEWVKAHANPYRVTSEED